MSLLLKALNKAEGEEVKQTVSDSSVDFDEVAAAPSATQSSDGKTAIKTSTERGGGVEDKRQRLVSASRVFGAKDKNVSPKKRGKGLVLVTVLLAIFGGGYYYLESTGISVEGLLGVDIAGIFEDERKGIAEPTRSVRPSLVADADGTLLLPKPSVDIQAEVDFTAFQNDNAEDLEIGSPEFNQRVAIITGYDIESRTPVREKQDINKEQDAATLEFIDLDVINAEKNRELKAELDSKTPSDSRLGGIVVKRLAAVDEGANVTESTKTTVSPENGVQKIAERNVSASASGIERKRMITRARDLYRNGAYAEAEAVYKNVLRASPTSIDALRGMAQLAMVTRRYQLAVATYLKILDFYPGDPFAVSGLTNLGGGSLDPYEVEKSLKNVLGKNKNLDGRVYFSLGNVYATQQRWRDAQDSYFQAFSHEPENPDYAYNLAVTLDYLNKQRLALRYYEEAIRLAKRIKISGFSVSAAKARVSELKDK